MERDLYKLSHASLARLYHLHLMTKAREHFPGVALLALVYLFLHLMKKVRVYQEQVGPLGPENACFVNVRACSSLNVVMHPGASHYLQ